jgi:hypothetical protein
MSRDPWVKKSRFPISKNCLHDTFLLMGPSVFNLGQECSLDLDLDRPTHMAPHTPRTHAGDSRQGNSTPRPRPGSWFGA